MAATSEIEKLERRHAENPQGRYFAPLADAYRKADQVDQALVLVRSGLENHPDYLSAHIVLGRCLLDKKDDPGAAQAFQRVLSLDGENIIALKSLAEIAERQSDLVQAREWLQKLLQVDPMNAEAEADLQRLGGAISTAATAPMEAIAVEEAASPEISFAGVLEAEAPPPPEPAAAALGLEPTAFDAGAQQPAAAPLEGVETVEFAPPTEAVAPVAEDTAPFGDGLHVPEEHVGVEEPAAGAGDAWQIRSSLSTPAPDLTDFEVSVEEPGAWEAAAPDQPEAAFSLPDTTEVEAGAGEGGELEMPELAPAEMAEPAPGLADLPLIMPEEVTPAAELARASARQQAMVNQPASAAAALEGLPIVGEAGAEAPVAEPETPPLLTETMGDLYLRQGFRAEAAEVYRRLLEQRPGDAGLMAKLASIEGPPPSLSAAALGSESSRSWLSRLAQARVGEPAPSPAPAATEGPSPLDSAFAQPEPEPSEPTGEPTRPAQDTFTLDAIFGAQGAPPAQPAPEPPPPPPAGTSFDEFFGAPPEQTSVRPDTAQPAAAPPLEDDVNSFNSWLRGLKR